VSPPLTSTSTSAPASTPRRIGLFGGAFDPVHDAHVALAYAALDQLALDEVRWVPTGQPWYKNSPMVAAVHRVAMVALAIADEPRFVLDARETERTGPTYTLDTVMEMQAEYAVREATSSSSSGAEWFLIIGQDQLSKFHTWHGWQALVTRVTLAVAGRAGDEPHLGAALQSAPIRLAEVALPPMEVSSTEIRASLAQGRSLAGLVPDAVARYIARHGLYASP
jgi:nicotinate-nucleotide adenylyltransferase